MDFQEIEVFNKSGGMCVYLILIKAELKVNLCPKLLSLENPFEFIWNLKSSFGIGKFSSNLKKFYPVSKFISNIDPAE